jgi:hypothetical protein
MTVIQKASSIILFLYDLFVLNIYSFITFLHSLPASQHTWSSSPQVFIYHQKKKLFWLSVEPVMHRFLQFVTLCIISKPPSRVQTDKNQKVKSLDCMVGGQELQISVPDGFPCYGQQNEGRVVQQKNTLQQSSSPLFVNHWLPFVSQHVTISYPRYCRSPFLIMLKDRTLGVPEHLSS